MDQLVRSVILVFLLGTVLPALPQTQTIGFSVFDEAGNAVKGIEASEVRLRIGKKDVPIESSKEFTDQALDLIVLIDRSISQELNIERQRAATAAIIQGAFKRGRDRIAIASFANKIVLHSDLSDDPSSALSELPAIKVEYPPGYMATPRGSAVFIPPGGSPPNVGGTALWDSLYDAATSLSSASSGDRRKVLLVFSDGYNTVGTRKKAEALTQVRLTGVATFFVGIADPKFTGMDQKSLRSFAEGTGGIALFPNRKMTDVDELAIKIVEAMRHNYLLTYSGSNSAGEIQIKVPGRKGVAVSHRSN